MAESVASCSSAAAVSADAAAGASIPDAPSILYCSAAPGAAPAGMTQLSALPASCEVATANQWVARSACFRSHQTHTKLSVSDATATTIQIGSRWASWGQAERTSPRVGAKR